MTVAEILSLVDAYLERNEISVGRFSEAIGERFDLRPQSAERRLNEARKTGALGEEWIDRLAVMIDAQDELHDGPLTPGLDAFCPKCREVQPSRSDGTCLWCDSQTGGNTVPNYIDPLGDERKERRSRNAGIPWKCSEEDIQEVRSLYLSGLSMRAACEVVHPRTDYANPNAMAMAMYSLVEQRGWNRRKQTEATAARNYRHGLSRDPAHRRRLRRAEGYVRGVMCAGVKRNAPGKGKPCQMAALSDSDYCRAHDPRYQEQHREHCIAMRAQVRAA